MKNNKDIFIQIEASNQSYTLLNFVELIQLEL